MKVMTKDDVDTLFANLKKRVSEDLNKVIAIAQKIIYLAQTLKVDVENNNVFIANYKELTTLTEKMLDILHIINLNTIMTRQNIIYLLGEKEFKMRFEVQEDD